MTVDEMKAYLEKRMQDIQGTIVNERVQRDSEKDQLLRLEKSIPARDEHLHALSTALGECEMTLKILVTEQPEAPAELDAVAKSATPKNGAVAKAA